jgi:hypothetical protein
MSEVRCSDGTRAAPSHAASAGGLPPGGRQPDCLQSLLRGLRRRDPPRRKLVRQTLTVQKMKSFGTSNHVGRCTAAEES